MALLRRPKGLFARCVMNMILDREHDCMVHGTFTLSWDERACRRVLGHKLLHHLIEVAVLVLASDHRRQVRLLGKDVVVHRHCPSGER